MIVLFWRVNPKIHRNSAVCRHMYHTLVLIFAYLVSFNLRHQVIVLSDICPLIHLRLGRKLLTYMLTVVTLFKQHSLRHQPEAEEYYL